MENNGNNPFVSIVLFVCGWSMNMIADIFPIVVGAMDIIDKLMVWCFHVISVVSVTLIVFINWKTGIDKLRELLKIKK